MVKQYFFSSPVHDDSSILVSAWVAGSVIINLINKFIPQDTTYCTGAYTILYGSLAPEFMVVHCHQCSPRESELNWVAPFKLNLNGFLFRNTYMMYKTYIQYVCLSVKGAVNDICIFQLLVRSCRLALASTRSSSPPLPLLHHMNAQWYLPYSIWHSSNRKQCKLHCINVL